MAGGFADEAPVGISARVGVADRGKPVEIEAGIGPALIVDEPAHALADDVACGLREFFDVGVTPSLSLPRLRGSVGGGDCLVSGAPVLETSGFCTASKPARKPRRLPSTPLPSARIAASNASTGIGRRPLPAMMPSITELMNTPFLRAIASMSIRI